MYKKNILAKSTQKLYYVSPQKLHLYRQSASEVRKKKKDKGWTNFKTTSKSIHLEHNESYKWNQNIILRYQLDEDGTNKFE